MVRKTKRRKPGLLIFIVFILILIVVPFVDKSTISLKKQPESEKISYDGTTRIPSSEMVDESSIFINSDELDSPYAILFGLKDNTILMQKNTEEIIYPASLTKMMTAIVAIENLPDLKEEIKLDDSMFQALYEANASLAGFQPDEKIKAIDLIYGVLLPSGAEACIGFADHIAGSEQEFVEIMNLKAEDLGMANTHFENTTGLHDENHYTTVKDMANLLSYALQDDTFRKVFTSSRYSTQPTNKHPDGITFYSTMFEKLKRNATDMDGVILGGKTGYTNEAGLCLASLAKVGTQEYILITAGAKGNQYSHQYHITDAVAVYSSIEK